ncbi:MAG: pirin family protein [Thiolinea sp.]
MTLKKLHRVQGPLSNHWVGDGFPVRTLLSYNSGLEQLQSPFLLLDYAGPHDFAPTEQRLGVGEHPHRGFETVTIVYDGEVEHRDSSGAGGKISQGDVQWMTAAGGVVHEEFHGRDFARRGGRFEMVQLWVNLPARDKMNPPGYQGILDSDIPVVNLADEQGFVRVIAGEFGGQSGPARTHTGQLVGHAPEGRSRAGCEVPDGYSTVVLVLQGHVQLNGEAVHEAEAALFELAGSRIQLATDAGHQILLLAGEPPNEPVGGLRTVRDGAHRPSRKSVRPWWITSRVKWTSVTAGVRRDTGPHAVAGTASLSPALAATPWVRARQRYCVDSLVIFSVRQTISGLAAQQQEIMPGRWRSAGDRNPAGSPCTTSPASQATRIRKNWPVCSMHCAGLSSAGHQLRGPGFRTPVAQRICRSYAVAEKWRSSCC